MIGAKKRFEVLKRDKFRCQYCWRNGKDVTLEVDHVKPKSKGWTDEFDNLITCCRECNIWKWQEELESWDSKFGIKAKDLYDKIKKEYYYSWNEEVKAAEEVYGKRFNWTLDMKTMGLIASFLQWWLDYHIKSEKRVKNQIEHIANYWLSLGINMDSKIVKSKDDPNIEMEVIEDFFRGWKAFDDLTWFLEADFISWDCYMWDDIFVDEVWNNIESLNERLNYEITINIKCFWGVPSWIIRKYSLFPNAEYEEC